MYLVHLLLFKINLLLFGVDVKYITHQNNFHLSRGENIYLIHEIYPYPPGADYKWSILDLFVVGVPDGRLRYGKPMAYYASLIHDALTQYRRELPITRKQAYTIFDAALKESGFFLRPLYVFVVKMFGQHGFLGDK